MKLSDEWRGVCIFSSVWLCNSMDCSPPGSSVLFNTFLFLYILKFFPIFVKEHSVDQIGRLEGKYAFLVFQFLYPCQGSSVIYTILPVKLVLSFREIWKKKLKYLLRVQRNFKNLTESSGPMLYYVEEIHMLLISISFHKENIK